MYVTEQDLAALAQTLREEFAAAVEGIRNELSVQITEAHNRTAGVSLDDVRGLLAELGVPGEQLTASEVQALIPEPVPYDDEEIKAAVLNLRTHANELADRIGAPRMEG